jgi:hypothetical protein
LGDVKNQDIYQPLFIDSHLVISFKENDLFSSIGSSLYGAVLSKLMASTRIFPTETCHKLGHAMTCPSIVLLVVYYFKLYSTTVGLKPHSYLGLFLSYPHHIKNGVMMMFP